MKVAIEPWSAGDLPLLERLNTPEMTQHLGRPETPDELTARHERYLVSWETGDARMFRIEVDGARCV